MATLPGPGPPSAGHTKSKRRHDDDDAGRRGMEAYGTDIWPSRTRKLHDALPPVAMPGLIAMLPVSRTQFRLSSRCLGASPFGTPAAHRDRRNFFFLPCQQTCPPSPVACDYSPLTRRWATCPCWPSQNHTSSSHHLTSSRGEWHHARHTHSSQDHHPMMKKQVNVFLLPIKPRVIVDLSLFLPPSSSFPVDIRLIVPTRYALSHCHAWPI